MSIFRNAEILYASPQAIKGMAMETSCLSRKHQEMDRNDAGFVDMAGGQSVNTIKCHHFRAAKSASHFHLPRHQSLCHFTQPLLGI